MSRTASQRRAQAGLPPARPASCTPTPTRTTRPRPSTSRRSPGPTRCCPTPTSGPATTASARPASAAAAAVRASTTCSRGGGLNDLFDAFFGGQSPFGGGGRRGPAGPPRGQDMEVVADIAFEQAVFGATVPVTLQLPQRCDDCGGTGAGAGTQPVTCADCNGSRAGPTGAPEPARSDGHDRRRARAAAGSARSIVTPCPTCRGEGRVTVEHTYQVDVPAGVDSGSTLRLAGAWRGRAARRRGRRPVRPPAGRRARALPARRQRPRHRRCRSRSPRPRSARPCALPTLDGDEELRRPGRHPAGPGVRAARSGRAAAAGPRPRRPARPARRRGADEARRRARPSCCASWPSKRGEPVQPAGQGPVLAHQVGVLVGRVDGRARCAARPAHVLVADVDAPGARRRRRPPPAPRAAPARRGGRSPSPTAPGGGGPAGSRPADAGASTARSCTSSRPRATRSRSPSPPPKGDRARLAGAEVHRGRRRPHRRRRRRALRRALGRRAGGTPPRPAAPHRRRGGDAVAAGVAARSSTARSRSATVLPRRRASPSRAAGR